jgi:hypothetical protein
MLIQFSVGNRSFDRSAPAVDNHPTIRITSERRVPERENVAIIPPNLLNGALQQATPFNGLLTDEVVCLEIFPLFEMDSADNLASRCAERILIYARTKGQAEQH